MAKNRPRARSSFPQLLISLVLIVGILYMAKPVIVPLAIAVLLTFILSPVVRFIQSHGLGRVPAVLMTVLLALVLFGGVGWGVGVQIEQLASELPDQQEKIAAKIADLRSSAAGPFAKLLEMTRELGKESEKPAAASERPAVTEKQIVIARPETSGFEQLTSALAPIVEPSAAAGLVLVLVIFGLIRREDLRNRMIGLLGHGHLTGTTRVLVDTAQRLSSFLFTQLLVNVAFGVIFGTGLLVIGVPYALLWGFLTAVLRFVPYVGTLFSVAFPLVLSFALFPGWPPFVSVLVVFVILELLTANVVEPVLFGHSTGVTPIALLVAAAFWTFLWGPIGLVLSTPLTLCLVVLGQHVPRFQFFTLLLGDEPALKPHTSYYQRLLSRDQLEASQVVEQHAKATGAERVYDDVLLPALILARRDRKSGDLNADDEEFILTATRQLLAQRETPAAPLNETVEPGAPTVLVLGCPAHDAAEELALHMLAQLLKPAGCRLDVASTHDLPGAVEARIERDQPALVVIAILPPGGVLQARYLCKRLHKRFANLPMIVGYWSETRSFDRLLVRLRAAGATYVTTSLLQTRSQLLALVRPAVLLTPAARQ